jgi:hypothetical protein
MTTKQMLFSALILGAVANDALASENSSYLKFDACKHDYNQTNVTARDAWFRKPNDTTIIMTNENDSPISIHHLGDLQNKVLENAYITRCPNFSVIKHTTKGQNSISVGDFSICDNAAIIQAYEKFKKDRTQQ